MQGLEGKDFFDNIRRSVTISHFIASIIPLALLVYFSLKYVYPYLSGGDVTRVPVDIVIILLLAVVVSVLGLVLLRRTTNSSISSAQNFNAGLNSLFDITKQFRETVYPDILLKKIVQSAADLTGAESGSLLICDDEGNLLSRVNVGKNAETFNNIILKKGEGIAGMVAMTGQTALIENVSPGPGCLMEPGSRYGTRSALCVPLVYAGSTIGVIELRNKRNSPFNKQDESLLYGLADQAGISIVQNRMRERQHADFIHITEMLVTAQDYILKRDGHARRVARYSNLIGKQMRLSEDELRILYYASLLHDIGMLKISYADQWDKEKIEQHPVLGFDLINPISMWSDSAVAVLHHHERYDGTGFPFSKKKEDIPLSASILTVADAFDALTSGYSRSLAKQLDYEAALSEIEANAGTQFDPDVVEALKTSIAVENLLKDQS
ncbi:MAG: GAF domain-containing protein [Nitrospirae bacterium]|nr:GAF domain-containing protein [Nitrospirota bacterium]